MARIRSIHPGLTSDEAYMSMSMTAKAAWTPLWMQCDDHGIFEWKPIVLKALIFPADNVDFAAVLAELEQLGCVRRLEIQGRPHGVVRNFAKYQRPKNPSYRHFKPDELPADVGNFIAVKGATPPALPQPSTSTTEIPPQMKEEGGKREEEEVKESSPTPLAPSASDAFERFKRAYPRRDGANPWQPAEKKFRALVKTGADPEAMIQAAAALAREEGARGNVGTKFIPQAITWLNQQRFQDQAVAAFSGTSDKLGMDDAVAIFAKTGQWSRFAPVSDISQAPPELLAKHGLTADGRRMQ
jgi:hypothetical protein